MHASAPEVGKTLAAGWPAYAAMGPFFLYLFGYLALRFQLSALGVNADLAVLDERYLFAGARFLIHIASVIPVLALLGLPVYCVGRAVRRYVRLPVLPASALLGLGIAFAAVMILGVMQRCFAFLNDLLLQDALPDPPWLHRVLLNPGGEEQLLFLGALLLIVMVTARFLVLARTRHARPVWAQAVLAVLLGIEIVLLPANFGVLIASAKFPRVAGANNTWVIWEGKEQVTYLVVDGYRSLVTIPRGKIDRIEIVGYDMLLPRFANSKRKPQQAGR